MPSVKSYASRVGVTADEYTRRQAAGEKWCGQCKTWHPRDAFGLDRDRADGLRPHCRSSRLKEKTK